MDGVVGGLSPAAGTRTCMQDAPHVGDVTSAEHSVPKWDAGVQRALCPVESVGQRRALRAHDLASALRLARTHVT